MRLEFVVVYLVQKLDVFLDLCREITNRPQYSATLNGNLQSRPSKNKELLSIPPRISVSCFLRMKKQRICLLAAQCTDFLCSDTFSDIKNTVVVYSYRQFCPYLKPVSSHRRFVARHSNVSRLLINIPVNIKTFSIQKMSTLAYLNKVMRNSCW